MLQSGRRLQVPRPDCGRGSIRLNHGNPARTRIRNARPSGRPVAAGRPGGGLGRRGRRPARCCCGSACSRRKSRAARSSTSRSRTRPTSRSACSTARPSRSPTRLAVGQAGRGQLLGLVVRPVRRRGAVLQDAARRNAGRFTFIGVNVQDQDADALAFMRKYGITYPNGSGNAGPDLDPVRHARRTRDLLHCARRAAGAQVEHADRRRPGPVPGRAAACQRRSTWLRRCWSSCDGCTRSRQSSSSAGAPCCGSTVRPRGELGQVAPALQGNHSS